MLTSLDKSIDKAKLEKGFIMTNYWPIKYEKQDTS